MSTNQLRKMKKRKRDALNAISVVEYLSKKLQDISPDNPELIDEELKIFHDFINKHEKINNNPKFQSLNIWSSYALSIKKDREEKINQQIRKSEKIKLNWKDFEELIIYKNEGGMSNENIAKEIKKRGAKCNRETIRLFLIKQK